MVHQNLVRKPPDTIFETVLERIDAFIFPHLCTVCDAPRTKGCRWFCSACYNEIVSAITTRRPCPRCSLNLQNRTCTCDLAWDFPFNRIVSFVDYTETIQTIMQHIKYQGKRDLAWFMGTICAPYLDKETKDSYDLVVPLPLHWLRKKRRGYNQAEWFARGVCAGREALKISPDLLKRRRATHTQTSLDKEERHKNVENAFSLAPRAEALLAGKRVLLVDDVITTGATTAAATQVLLDGGCADVMVLSLARD